MCVLIVCCFVWLKLAGQTRQQLGQVEQVTQDRAWDGWIACNTSLTFFEALFVLPLL